MSRRGYILVEGHGEVEAAHNLVTRLSQELGVQLPWTRPRRWKNLHLWDARRGGIASGAELFRRHGVTRDAVLKALMAIRGNQRVTDQNPENKYQALERFCIAPPGRFWPYPALSPT